MHILFIDDDELRTKPLREGLALYRGYSVQFAETPEEAVKIFKDARDPIDGIIVDIMIPHNDIPDYRDFAIHGKFSNNQDGMYTGLQIICKLQEIMKERDRKIPIIVLTCIENIREYLEVLKADGRLLHMPAAILIKPVFLSDFVEEVDNAINAQPCA